MPSPVSRLPSPVCSLELFPPRTPAGWDKLPALLGELATLRPSFFSVTYGAGGSDQNGTYDTLMKVVDQTGIEAAPHLTCVGSTRARIAALLTQYREAGVRRIVALRGDLPATSMGSDAPGAFRYANELVAFVREQHGDHFRIEVAAYPEMHPQAASPEADFEAFRRKAEAGADAAITQYFFNADAYFDFVDRCVRANLTLPVVPGIMPITNHAQLTRFSAACGAEIPRWIRLRLEQLKDDKAALLDFGTETVTRLCESLRAGGAPGLHIYTLNQSEPTRRLWRNLGLTP
ncbi:methylenetetrahydrofolate reductase [NAD(P)H] [Panacagrimonas sp.]|uniref:methylenetetrahydrofolate reductase [NAD(P)H] n=1 Tax=Panacagrimonas sp. TaxID=2480088 RepID=UPI003B52114D